MRRGIRSIAAAVAPLIGLTILAGSPAHATPAFAPINHMVVLMQENRSFDHYLGQLHAYQVAQHGSSTVEAEPVTGNPNPAGGAAITPFHQTSYCEVADLDHSWDGTHSEWNSGAMDGFTAANVKPADPTGSRTMGYYNATDLPYYYALYDTFAMSDTFFSSVLSQTFPNRFYLLAGTSFGHIANDFPFPPGESPVTGFAPDGGTIFNKLDDAGATWRVYFNEVPFSWLFGYVRNGTAGHVFPISQYYADAAAGLLPDVAFVDPTFIATVNVENDEHPPANIQNGQKLVHDVLGALMASPNWPDSAAFLTYDEHGGYYDHLRPPTAVEPDALGPNGHPTQKFDQLGIRVPFVVVSPFAKVRYNSTALPIAGGTAANPTYTTSAKIYSHTSILKTIEDRFTIPAGQTYLTNRDASSNNLADLFDFDAPAFATPPALPDATINVAQAVDCEVNHEHVPTEL
ncbi:MAG: phospholipase C [Actinomycetota bacterium]|nr:alkaline phosphatase family protein [Actinomycetota bacterium]